MIVSAAILPPGDVDSTNAMVAGQPFDNRQTKPIGRAAPTITAAATNRAGRIPDRARIAMAGAARHAGRHVRTGTSDGSVPVGPAGSVTGAARDLGAGAMIARNTA